MVKNYILLFLFINQSLQAMESKHKLEDCENSSRNYKKPCFSLSDAVVYQPDLMVASPFVYKALEAMKPKHKLEDGENSSRDCKKPRFSLPAHLVAASPFAYQVVRAASKFIRGNRPPRNNSILLDKITTVTIKAKESQSNGIPLFRNCFELSFLRELAANNKDREVWLELVNEEECVMHTPFSMPILKVIAELLANYEAVKSLGFDITQTYVGLHEVLARYSIDTESKKAELIQAIRFFKLPFFQAIETHTFGKALQLLEQAKSTDTLYSTVERENLKTLIEADSQHAQKMKVQGTSYVDSISENQLNMTPSKKRRIAFTLAKTYEAQKYMLGFNDVLDDRSWQDLEIVAGSQSSPKSFFAFCIDQTVTELGKALLYKRIVYPTSNVTFLRQQQEILKALISHHNFNQIDRCLKELGEIEKENNMLSFWDNDELNLCVKSTEINVPRWQQFSKWLNECSLTVEILREGPQLYLVIIVAEVNKLKNKIVLNLKNFQSYLNLDKNKVIEIIKDVSSFEMFVVKEVVFNPFIASILMAKISGAVGGAAGGYAGYGFQFLSMISNADAMKDMIVLHFALQKKLMLVAQYIAKIKELYTLLKTDVQDLESTLPFLKALNIERLQQDAQTARMYGANNIFSQFWAKVSSASDIDNLLNSLETATFQGEPSKYSFTGRIVSAYRIMHDCKDKLIQPLGAVGELDMYMSIARLYKKYKEQNLEFCLPTYNVSPSPFIRMNQFWNPMVGNTAVPNSLTIGGNLPQNVVITGPNGGGKSTVMKSVVLAVIMAQTLGICPAQSMEFTPFVKIRSYLNMTDDITKGQSLFQAIAQRAVDIHKDVAGVSQGECSLTLFDELFDGTEAQAGEALACAFIQDLNKMKHNICLLITHFQQLPRIIDNMSVSRNFQVAVDPSQAKLIYPYKLESGVSKESVAFKVLAERGFDKELLGKAEKVRQTLRFKHAFEELQELMMQGQELPEELQRDPELITAIRNLINLRHYHAFRSLAKKKDSPKSLGRDL